ncbi:ATP-binding protein [Olsenella uli]|uniref:ATP-binding protein n=1 Tax=Olsenella uli TaxID=133926 RepID=UPI001958CC50|nr:DUF4143 domain-containing protein [Olsenella uli]MBM6676935.1 ATP-binding protein [Olsenella uli]
MERYLPRVFDRVLERRLASKDAVLIEGAKWCGKTSTAERQAASVLYMQRPETREQNIRLAEISPSLLLQGDAPRLIDEWQLAPKLWDAVRFEADRRQEFGQFILTGSTVPPKKGERRHTGIGRIGRMRMRPMALMESGESTGAVSLGDLFAGKSLPIAPADITIDRLAFLVARGGWPRAIGQGEAEALQQAYDYLDAVVEDDISEVDGVARDPSRARRIMRSYARFTASQGKISQMVADVAQSDDPSADMTVRSYLTALRNLFVIEELPAWNPNLRSKAAIRTTETRHFTDPSIAVAALGTSPDGLLRDLETFGLLFESMCVRDLRTYMDGLGGFVSHYRDSSGLECDAVAHLRDGSYGLIEIKLGGDGLVAEGARSLLKLRKTIDTSRMGEPAFLMVLTGVGEYSYPREDGVLVVPIGTLGV